MWIKFIFDSCQFWSSDNNHFIQQSLLTDDTFDSCHFYKRQVPFMLVFYSCLVQVPLYLLISMVHNSPTRVLNTICFAWFSAPFTYILIRILFIKMRDPKCDNCQILFLSKVTVGPDSERQSAIPIDLVTNPRADMSRAVVISDTCQFW